MTVLLAQEFQHLCVLGQRGHSLVAVRHDHGVVHDRWAGFDRDLDVDRVAVKRLDLAQHVTDHAWHGAILEQAAILALDCLVIDARRDQHGDAAALDAGDAWTAHQRQRWRWRIGWNRRIGCQWQRCRHIHAQTFGHAGHQHVIDVGQQRQHTLAHGRRLHAGQLETECVDDVVLLGRGLALPEQTRLRVVVSKQFRIAAHFVRCNRLREAGEACRTSLVWHTAAQRIRFVVHAAAVDGLAMETVALVVLDLDDRRVDRDLVEVRAAQTGQLGILVREVTTLQQRIVREVDARHDVRRAECDLLGFGEEVVRIAVQHHLADRGQRHQFFRDQLGRIEHVEREAGSLFFGEDLQAQFPFREVAGFDGFPQVAAVEVGIGARDTDSFIPHQRVRTLHWRPVEFHEARFALCIDQAERVHAEALHRAVAARNGAVRHRPHQHVRDFRRQRGEIPERVVGSGRLRHRVMRFRLGCVHQVRELHGVLDEEHRDVVTHQIPVAFFGIELDCETAHVACGVGRTTLTGHGREAQEHWRALALLGERDGTGQRAEVVVGLEITVGSRAACVHDALRDALMVEMADLFAQDEVFEQGRTTQAGLQRMLVVRDRDALVGRQVTVGRVDAHAVEWIDGGVFAFWRIAVADFVIGDDFGRRAAGGGVGRRLEGFADCWRTRRIAILAGLVGIEWTRCCELLLSRDFIEQTIRDRVADAKALWRLGIGWTGYRAQDRSGAVE